MAADGTSPVPLPYSPDKSLIGYMEKGQQTAGDPGPIEAREPAVASPAPNPAEREAAVDALKNMIGLGETFARKACEECGMEFSGTSIDTRCIFPGASGERPVRAAAQEAGTGRDR